LLRQDARFCEAVATLDQAAALEGKTVAQLTGREAIWGVGEPDYVGPDFGAAWGGSAEEKAIAERVKDYTDATRKRIWGE
jgi:hypothetical protein